MIQHRIRELREAKGWSQERLAAEIGRTKSVISRLESGETKLDIEVAHRIATALAVPVQDVLGIEYVTKGFSEDIKAFDPPPSDPLRAFIADHRFAYIAQTDALDLAGVHRGDVLVINDSADAARNPQPLQIVSVLYHPSSNGKALHLLRQFVPPRLLITNSSQGNDRPIDLVLEQATIVGVVENIHRRMGRS